MRMPVKENLPEFFYIARARDRALCGGVATNCGIATRNVPIWRKPGEYEWARRFATVEKAMEYATHNLMFGVLIVDRSGNVIAVREAEEVTQRA